MPRGNNTINSINNSLLLQVRLERFSVKDWTNAGPSVRQPKQQINVRITEKWNQKSSSVAAKRFFFPVWSPHINKYGWNSQCVLAPPILWRMHPMETEVSHFQLFFLSLLTPACDFREEEDGMDDEDAFLTLSGSVFIQSWNVWQEDCFVICH